SKTFTLSVDGNVLTTQSQTGTTLWYTWDTTRLSNGTRTLTASVTMNGQTATTTLPVNVNNGGAGGGGSGVPAISLNVSVHTPKVGDTSAVSLTVSNPGPTVTTDAYVGLVIPAASGASFGCPQGDALAFATQGSSTYTI